MHVITDNSSEMTMSLLKELATSRIAHLKKFSIHFLSLSFVIHVTLLHPGLSLFLHGLLLTL